MKLTKKQRREEQAILTEEQYKEAKRKRRSESHKGQIPWCVGQRRLSGKNHPMFGKHPTEESRKKMSEAQRRRCRDPHRNPVSEETRRKISESKLGNKHNLGRKHSYERRLKMMEFIVGGFWYGNVRYKVTKKYCNMWNRLRDSGRIGAFWGFLSVLSGETNDLVYHHVYYQEKACCHWDEDYQGYYAWINSGTPRRPVLYKYYIDGDPNKFVPLTRAENSMVNYNQLEWIKVFESIIKANGDKCYLTKEEMTEYTLSSGVSGASPVQGVSPVGAGKFR